MTTAQIKRLVQQSAASEDKEEQLQVRRDYVAVLNRLKVVEQLYYVTAADSDAQQVLELALRNLFHDSNRLRQEGLRDELFSENSDGWLDEGNGKRWHKLAM
jgi:hypothetical protein